MKEKVLIASDLHEIDVKPITLIFNKQHLKTEYPERVMISCFDSLKHFEEIKKIDKYTASLFRMTIPEFSGEISKENLSREGTGHKHLIGLYSLTFNFISQDKKFGWSYPESFLHPSVHGNLGDAMIILSSNSLLNKFLLCVNQNKFDSYINDKSKNIKDYFFGVICNGNLKSFKKGC